MPTVSNQSPRHALRTRLFAALYNQLASHYDRISAAAFAGEWSQWQAIATHLIDRQPVVELGCGTGRLLAVLIERGIDAYGVDLSWSMLRQARRRQSPGRLLQAAANALPLQSASVGVLLSVFPTTYILEPTTWAEAGRVLAPGGRLIVLDHGWLEGHDPARVGLRLLHWLVYGGVKDAVGTPCFPAAWPLMPLTERSPHGFASIWIATKPAIEA